MSNPRYQLISKVLLGSALVMLLLGLYLMLAMGNTVVGLTLIVVAVADVTVATVFARRST
jgi:hypothetical protein